MTLRSVLTTALAGSLVLSPALAHPGEEHSEAEINAELALRNLVAEHTRRGLDKCANSAAALQLKQRAMARRAATAQAIREKRGIQSKAMRSRRDVTDLEKWGANSHNETGIDAYTVDTSSSTIFASNATCVLVPEVTIGPYYVAGELQRTNLTDGERGVPLHLELQFVDVSTCAGVSSLLVDVWHANATGSYSGVSAAGNGGLDTTHGRGVQQSGSDGVVAFDTNFPGHYSGRAVHIHVMATADASVLPNGTFTGGTARHIGQLFFDSALQAAVEATQPYASNTNAITTNDEDSIAAEAATSTYDPFVDYVVLGDSVADGVLAWITIAVDTSADYTDQVSAAAHYYAGGGVAESGSSSGGSDGAPGMGGGNGTAPAGGWNGTTTAAATTTTAGAATTGTTTSTSISTTVSAAAARRRHHIGWR